MAVTFRASVLLSIIACLASPRLLAAEPAAEGGYRKLAPGVEVTIPIHEPTRETFSRHDIVELLTVDPQYGEREGYTGIAPAKDVKFTHDAHALEFTFKPVRFIEVDLPTFAGKARRKQIWYLLYHVKNLGDKPYRFIPRFELHSIDHDKWYPARLIPLATAAIQKREDPNRELKNIVEIAGDIPPSTPEEDKSVWGVVTWEDVDPQTDRFSIYVTGLSRSYRWEDPAGAYKAGEPLGAGRKFERKILQLNFWRPSDDRFENEREIRFGAPDEVDYRWIYR